MHKSGAGTGSDGPLLHILCSVTSVAVGTTLMQPVDVIRTRLYNQPFDEQGRGKLYRYAYDHEINYDHNGVCCHPIKYSDIRICLPSLHVYLPIQSSSIGPLCLTMLYDDVYFISYVCLSNISNLLDIYGLSGLLPYLSL